MNYYQKQISLILSSTYSNLKSLYESKGAGYILISLGLYTAGLFLKKLTYELYKIIQIQVPINYIERYGKNSWALVTGASDGIGREFCLKLARQGFNIILIARSKSKLEAVAAELRVINASIGVKIFVADFSNAFEESFFEDIEKSLEDFDISILVNNVGAEIIRQFEDTPIEVLKQIVTVNTAPMVFLTKMLIEKMKRRKHRSAIINISSLSAVNPIPFFSTYSASKAFTDFFSRALAQENRGSKLDILCVKPGYVSTKMTAYKEVGLNTIKSEDFVQSVLRRLGRRSETHGHWRHSLYAAVVNLPEIGYYYLGKAILRKEMESRQRAHASL